MAYTIPEFQNMMHAAELIDDLAHFLTTKSIVMHRMYYDLQWAKRKLRHGLRRQLEKLPKHMQANFQTYALWCLEAEDAVGAELLLLGLIGCATYNYTMGSEEHQCIDSWNATLRLHPERWTQFEDAR